MGLWTNLKSDLKFNSDYGDYEIDGGDLLLSKSPLSICKNTIIERYKTNYGDFILNPEYGGGLEDFIGKGISKKLVEDLITRLRYTLTFDDFLTNNELKIIPIILENEVKLFVYLIVDGEDIDLITVNYNEEGITFDK